MRSEVQDGDFPAIFTLGSAMMGDELHIFTALYSHRFPMKLEGKRVRVSAREHGKERLFSLVHNEKRDKCQTERSREAWSSRCTSFYF